MSRSRLPADRLKQALSRHDRAIQRAFLRVIRERASSINVTELANAIEARDFNRALNIEGINRAIVNVEPLAPSGQALMFEIQAHD